MTTAEDIVRVAEEVRANGEVYREPSGYVSIQQCPPYDAASGNDRFGTMWVEHCGISAAYILTKAGLRFGIDYPDGIQYSPSLCNQLLSGGYEQTAGPGAIGVIDWQWAGWGSCGASDHVVLIIEDRGDTLVTIEANTTPDGRLYYYERSRSLFTAIAMPKNLGVALPPEPVKPTPQHLSIPFIEGDDELMQIIHLTNEDTQGIPRDWGVIGGTLFPIDAPEVNAPDAEHIEMSVAIFQNLYAKYVRKNRLALDLTPLKPA